MNKIKNIFIIFFIIVLFISNNSNAHSSNIESVKIDVNIKDINAEITEIWKGYFNIGTEFYRSYNNKKIEDISNFCVYENGIKFDYIDNWQIENNVIQKNNKSSIIETIDGIEMVWGIGENGYHEYKIKYTINNIIKENELNLNLLDNNSFIINKMDLVIKDEFPKDVFYKLDSISGKIINNNKILFSIQNPNNDLCLYINYNGMNEEKANSKKIIIRSKDKSILFSNLKIVLKYLIIFLTMIVFLLKKSYSKTKYIFKPF